MKYSWALILLLLKLVHCHLEDVIRTTEYGLVRGQVKVSNSDKNIQYTSFIGIPYAAPPVGHLRFHVPVKHSPWNDIKNTTSFPSICVQFNKTFTGDEVFGSEDCLYLEISEPLTARNGSKELLPVLVWIHGGTFVFGSLKSGGPDYFMDKPIVLVSIQYRLNVFGFLSTNDQYASGNFGLKDQLFALKWIQRNIANFGGDPNKITISGGSAGAASVQLHCLSSQSKGLFQRAISLSGTPLDRWALQRNPLEMVYKLAKGLGLVYENNKQLVKELRKVEYQTLIKAVYDSSIMGLNIPYYVHPFAPSVEPESPDAFISKSPFELLREGNYKKVPHLMGYTTEEGSFGYDYFACGALDINIYKENPKLVIPPSMNIPSYSLCNNVTLEAITEFYFKNGSLTNRANWIRFMNQELFNRGIMKTAELQSIHNKVYFYITSYAGTRPTSFEGGVGHYDDVWYLFYPRGGRSAIESPSDVVVRKQFVTFWTNFVMSGNPTPYGDPLLENIIWPNWSDTGLILDIDTKLSVQRTPDDVDKVFWNNLFEKCGFEPYYTY